MSESNESNESNLIPQSDALAEAQVDSLSELFSRDPEGFTKIDLVRLVEELRAQRARFAKSEAEGKRPGKPAKAASSPKTSKLSDKLKQIVAEAPQVLLTATTSAEDLGL